MEPFKVNVSLHMKASRKLFGRAYLNSNAVMVANYSQRVDIEQISPETFSLSVTPEKRGSHKLYMKFDDSYICGSPIPIYVTVDPKKIMAVCKPKIIFLHNSTGIKLQDEKIYVSQAYEGLKILEATHMKLIKTLELPGMGEILVGKDHFYYADITQNKLVKADLNGTTISSIGTQGDKAGQFNFPNGMQLSKDNEIYVCDTNNHRIQVFDQDLKFLRIIGSRGMADGCFEAPDGLDIDENGNIYVVDESKNCIQVLTPQGQHIRNIGQGKDELDKPISAAIHRNMIYITEALNKRISVFTTMGDFVTTFGEGIFTRPECIAIDENGHIYVTDSRTHVIKF